MHRPAAHRLRALVIIGAIVALVLAIGLAGSGSVKAAKPPKPTPTPTATPTPTPTPQIPAGLRAGLRASNYGITPFPSPSWWVDSIGSMASRFPSSTREQLAVVVEVSGGGGRGKCWAHFPQPATGTWPNVNWDDMDLFESTFDAFDAAAGVKVWLQVEPASCDVPMLIDLALPAVRPPPERHRLRRRRRVVPQGHLAHRQADHRRGGRGVGRAGPHEERRPTSSWSSTG